MTSEQRTHRVYIAGPGEHQTWRQDGLGVPLPVGMPTVGDIRALRNRQITITFEETTLIYMGPYPVMSRLEGQGSNAVTRPEVLREVALNGMLQIERCDLVYLRVDGDLTDCVSLMEAGYALALSIPVFIDIGPGVDRQRIGQLVAASVHSVEENWRHEFLPSLPFFKWIPASEWTTAKYVQYLKFLVCD